MRECWAQFEASFLLKHRQRPDGWPVGPEQIVGMGFYSPARTVQLIEQRRPGRRGRFVVATYFPFRRFDLRFPPVWCATLSQARRIGFDRLRAAGDGTLTLGRAYGLDLARSASVIGLEVLR